jgi:tyrosyl-tRNA synthetase
VSISTVSSAAILDDLIARGLVHDATDQEALRARLDEGPITVYAGFDPTGDSLHVGHLVPLLLLRRFQQFGHRPVALAGGATGMIGDPGGRSTERNLLDAATLDRNLLSITDQLRAFLDFDHPQNAARLVDNREWTGSLGVLEFLRDVGKHVTVNTMLAKESVKARVQSEHGISFTEFSYMLLQANDYRHLHDEMGVELQVGGSDQWGNITAGIDLIRRTTGAHTHGLTVPLVTRADGQKFGKSTGDAVWLAAERTSAYAFYQYFVNTDDRDVERFLLQLTLVPVEEIRAVMDAHREAPERRSAQRTLAGAVTALVHGEQAADEAARASSGFTRSVSELEEGEWAALVDAVPTATIDTALADGDLVEVLVAAGVLASKGEGRRLIAQGGLYVNDVPADDGRTLGPGDWAFGRYCMVRRGKKQRHLLVRS